MLNVSIKHNNKISFEGSFFAVKDAAGNPVKMAASLS